MRRKFEWRIENEKYMLREHKKFRGIKGEREPERRKQRGKRELEREMKWESERKEPDRKEESKWEREC